MSHPLRTSFEKDLEDSLLFLKEVLIVVWRFNPAGVAAYACGQLFESLSDATPNDQKSAMVAEVLANIQIVPVESFEQDFSSGISHVCKGIASEVIRSAIKEHPQIENYLRESVGDEEVAITSSFSRMTMNSIAKQRDHYQQLYAHYSQLIEFLPRYTSIMGRTGFLEGVLGFAAGFFGGYVGVAGAEAWGNWRNSNDQEFCQKFGNAFEQFAQACINYTTQGEQSLSLVFDRLIDEVRRVHQRIFDCYERLAEAGWDIEPLYRRYRTFDDPLDDETKQLFEIAIANLEENRSIHYRTIENIRSMVGLGGIPSLPNNKIQVPVPSHQHAIPPPLPGPQRSLESL
jgi:hypothetical protein